MTKAIGGSAARNSRFLLVLSEITMTGALCAAAAAGLGNPITLAAAYDVNDFSFAPADALANFRLESDGDIGTEKSGGNFADIGDWLSPKSGMNNFDARATVTSGALGSGVVGTWLNLGTTRFWGVSQSGFGESICTFTLEIRRTSTGQVLDSATVTVTATVEI